jgi:hypothetical protein
MQKYMVCTVVVGLGCSVKEINCCSNCQPCSRHPESFLTVCDNLPHGRQKRILGALQPSFEISFDTCALRIKQAKKKAPKT